MNIRLYATLQPLVGGRSVSIASEEGDTVGSLLLRLIEAYPRLDGHLLTPDGAALLPHVQVFLSGRSVRDLQGLNTPVSESANIAIFPPVAGG